MMNQKRLLSSLPLLAAVLVVGSLVYAPDALASSNSTQFANVFESTWDILKGWSQGTLGKIISIVIIIAGAGIMIARQSLMPFLIAIAAAICLYQAPNIIEGIMTDDGSSGLVEVFAELPQAADKSKIALK